MNIRLLRKSLRLNQDEFGHVFGVKKITILRWEKERHKGNEEFLLSLIEFLEENAMLDKFIEWRLK